MYAINKYNILNVRRVKSNLNIFSEKINIKDNKDNIFYEISPGFKINFSKKINAFIFINLFGSYKGDPQLKLSINF